MEGGLQCQRRLKLFGFHVSDEEVSTSPLGSSTPLSTALSTTAAALDNRRHECQYCCREFANSQALGGHQNAHKKERQQLKRAQMHQAAGMRSSPSTLYPRSSSSLAVNPISSSFSPPHHLLSAVPAANVASPPSASWVYFSRPGPPLHVSHGCVIPSRGPQYCGDHVGDGPVRGVDRSTGSEEVCGLDLHLSLAPAGS